MNSLNPSLYQINTRVWLNQLGRQIGRPATLDDIPDAELDWLLEAGFDWVWLLSVWETGEAARKISRSNAQWRSGFLETLPDLRDEDIFGSGFAIKNYRPSPQLGGDAALQRLRKRLSQRGLRLMLDFVPNHMAPDHPWAAEHPDYFIQGTEADLQQAPQNYLRMSVGGKPMILAHGRDPYFPGWPDTLQLDYSNPALQQAMREELLRIAQTCDGVRCDMAMLVLPDVFQRTWNRSAPDFWPEAIRHVKVAHPDFIFMAEVYWDLEWRLQQEGFDYTYDKRLYDRLREGHTDAIRRHLWAGLDFQSRMARFLENHDEPRAAVTFSMESHLAAAAITYLAPGLRFFQQGQFEGRTKHISPHLGRAPEEPINQELQACYRKLLGVLRHKAVREGRWQLLDVSSAWDGNASHEAVIAYEWQGTDGEEVLVVVNYAPHPSQAFVRPTFAGLAGRKWALRDELTPAEYDRDGDELLSRGLYVDVPAWQTHAFFLTPRVCAASK